MPAPALSRRTVFALLLLVLTTVLWGSTFIITKRLTDTFPPAMYMTFRFGIAAASLLPFAGRIRKVRWKEVKASILAATIYFFSLLLQTIGMRFTTASKAGFLTGLNVILVPVFLGLIFKQRQHKVTWVAAALATGGTLALSTPGDGLAGVSPGDPLVVACAVLYAVYIIFIDRKCLDIDLRVFCTIQLAFVFALSFGTSLVIDHASWVALMQPGAAAASFTPLAIGALVYMAVPVTALTFFFQVHGQKHVAPAKVALIFALEPVFAAIFAAWIGGQAEWLTPVSILGAAVIVAATVLPALASLRSRTLGKGGLSSLLEPDGGDRVQ